jgi:hypothetical protein
MIAMEPIMTVCPLTTTPATSSLYSIVPSSNFPSGLSRGSKSQRGGHRRQAHASLLYILTVHSCLPSRSRWSIHYLRPSCNCRKEGVNRTRQEGRFRHCNRPKRWTGLRNGSCGGRTQNPRCAPRMSAWNVSWLVLFAARREA